MAEHPTHPTVHSEPPPSGMGGAAPAERMVLANRFLFLGLIGAGGMGSVYRARDLWLEETVALKTITAASLVALGREVRLARRITHPNVVRVYDLGSDEDMPFITMEYVDGGSLGALRGGQLAPPEVVEIGKQICAGLTAAHAAGIVHRDLKPANVLVSSSGVVKLTDFGIATALLDDEQAGHVGTPAFMAPEQAEGGLVDARTDVYGLGRVLLDLLVGDDVHREARESGIDIRERLEGHAPDELVAVVARCLSQRRDDRFSSAAAVAAALHSSVPARLTSVPSRVRLARRLVVRATPAPPEYAELVGGVVDATADVLRHADGIEVVSAGIEGGSGVVAIVGPLTSAATVDADLHLRVDPVDDDRVRLEARLVGRRDALVLWQRTIECGLEDVLVWARDTATATARMLDARLRGLAREPLTDPRALDLFLRARHELGRRWPGALARTIELLEQARKASPADPLVIASLAVANAMTLTVTTDADALDRTEALAARARALAPERAEGYLAIGFVSMQRGEEAEAAGHFSTCLELAPSLGEAHAQLGLLLAETGPIERARRHLATGVQLDRSLLTFRWAEARLAYLTRAGDFRAFFEPEPSVVPQLNFYWLNRCRVAIYGPDARLTDDEVEAFESSPPFDLKERLRPYVALSQRAAVPRDALGIGDDFARCDARLRRRRALGRILTAELAAALGDWNTATRAFVAAADEGSRDVVWADHCPLALAIRHRAGRDPTVIAAYEAIAARAAELREVLGATR